MFVSKIFSPLLSLNFCTTAKKKREEIIGTLIIQWNGQLNWAPLPLDYYYIFLSPPPHQHLAAQVTTL
jgi:hypothetical protein